jgi:hypothetical protein
MSTKKQAKTSESNIQRHRASAIPETISYVPDYPKKHGDNSAMAVTRTPESEISESIPSQAKPVAKQVPTVLPIEYTHDLTQDYSIR